MSGMALQRGASEQRVRELDIAVQEDSLPRDQDIIEYGERVRFLEARAQRVVPFRLVADVERLPTDEAQPRRVGIPNASAYFSSPGRSENGSG
jgi:hypothetical protein